MRTLVFISNFSQRGRGTYAVSAAVAQSRAFAVTKFDVYTSRRLAGPLGSAISLVRLVWLLATRRPDMILADTQVGIILAFLASRLTGSARPTIRFGNLYRRPLGYNGNPAEYLKISLERQAMRKANLIIVPSAAARDSLSWLGRNDIAVIPNGMSIAPCAGPIPDAAKNTLSLLFVGRLDARKNPLLAVKAAANLLAKLGPDCLTFEIIGDGPMKGEVEDAVNSAGLAGVTTFHGYKATPWNRLPSHCILLHPAEFEGFGYVVIEAIFRGIPVVTFRDVGGPAEIVDETGGGIVVAERTPGAMAQAVTDLTEDFGALRDQMMRAQRIAENTYSLETMVASYDRALLSAADEVRQ